MRPAVWLLKVPLRLCPNLEFDLTNLPQYHGTAKFHGGTIKIQNHLPMWGDFNAKFVLDGPRVHLPRIDINTDRSGTNAKRV